MTATDPSSQSAQINFRLSVTRKSCSSITFDLECHFTADKCFGDAAYECSLCYPQFNLHDGYCFKNCPDGFYPEDTFCHCNS